METYEKLLDSAYKKVKVIEKDTGRFEVPQVSGKVAGKNTIITNIGAIATHIRRPVEHLAKYLQKELAISGKVDKDRLILNTRLNSIKVNDKMNSYVKEFVLCDQCKKPDTEIITEKGIKYKNCLACGSKSPVRSL